MKSRFVISMVFIFLVAIPKNITCMVPYMTPEGLKFYTCFVIENKKWFLKQNLKKTEESESPKFLVKFVPKETLLKKIAESKVNLSSDIFEMLIKKLGKKSYKNFLQIVSSCSYTELDKNHKASEKLLKEEFMQRVSPICADKYLELVKSSVAYKINEKMVKGTRRQNKIGVKCGSDLNEKLDGWDDIFPIISTMRKLIIREKNDEKID